MNTSGTSGTTNKSSIKINEDNLNSYRKTQLQYVNWWIKNTKQNIKDIIKSLEADNSEENAKKQLEILKDQYRIISLIKSIKEGKTILKGYNYKKFD